MAVVIGHEAMSKWLNSYLRRDKQDLNTRTLACNVDLRYKVVACKIRRGT
jgi:hypothetical protein